ncbi:MAG TPA: apolipoprotein N-acyltransferase [Micropepsaceae bacterium]|nr:apolipoprotein N-acyltransferase [Micropepsaceae bacterium]
MLERLLALLDSVAMGLVRARGLRRLAIAFGLGATGALAFEPFEAFPLLLLSYTGVVLLFDGAAMSPDRFRRAAAIGWAYGFGFFLVGLYWIGYAFLVDAQEHAWELPFVAVLLPSGFAIFFAAAALLCMLKWGPGVQRIFVFAFAFSFVEWLRGHILTGFPWNLPAYGWGVSTALLQSASVFGAYGLSILTILLGASLAGLAPDTKDARSRWLPGVLALFFVALWVDGAARLYTAGDTTVAGVRLRIVQPDTPQPEKYAAALRERNWQRLIDLSNAPAATQPTHIIWPEAAPPFPLQTSQEALDQIAKVTGDSRVILTGDVRIEDVGEPGSRVRHYFNSFRIFGPHGKLLATSDKFHLVPFGEYLPFEERLRAIGLTEIAANTGFSSGPGPQTFDVPDAPAVGPLICYEVIFPQAVTGSPRPQWLVNMTDDSWFGPNSGPMQHFLIARVRAIEEGLPIARAANSGISAVIDGNGRVRARLDLGLRGVLDADLPAALPITPYARYGSAITLALFLVLAGAALWPMKATET